MKKIFFFLLCSLWASNSCGSSDSLFQESSLQGVYHSKKTFWGLGDKVRELSLKVAQDRNQPIYNWRFKKHTRQSLGLVHLHNTQVIVLISDQSDWDQSIQFWHEGVLAHREMKKKLFDDEKRDFEKVKQEGVSHKEAYKFYVVQRGQNSPAYGHCFLRLNQILDDIERLKDKSENRTTSSSQKPKNFEKLYNLSYIKMFMDELKHTISSFAFQLSEDYLIEKENLDISEVEGKIDRIYRLFTIILYDLDKMFLYDSIGTKDLERLNQTIEKLEQYYDRFFESYHIYWGYVLKHDHHTRYQFEKGCLFRAARDHYHSIGATKVLELESQIRVIDEFLKNWHKDGPVSPFSASWIHNLSDPHQHVHLSSENFDTIWSYVDDLRKSLHRDLVHLSTDILSED